MFFGRLKFFHGIVNLFYTYEFESPFVILIQPLLKHRLKNKSVKIRIEKKDGKKKTNISL